MKRIFTFLVTLFLFAGVAFSQNFVTIMDGDITNPAVWSKNGGNTSCNCTPWTELPSLITISSGVVTIDHDMTSTKDLYLLGINVDVTINATGSLSGPFLIEIRSGEFFNYGDLSVENMEVQNGGFLYNYGTMIVDPGDLVIAYQGRAELGGIVEVPNGNMTNDGTVQINRDARITIGGFIDNNEFIRMEPSACVNVFGDVTNDGSISLINGPGNAYIESGSNISNNDNWDTTVDYCAGGSATGLSHTANCSNCGILPVELAGFEASLSQGTVSLSWETSTETGNAFFTVLRSQDGQNFEELTQVNSESPVEGRVYEIYDMEPFAGVSYYRLQQTDLDGKTRKLETVLINNSDDISQQFKAFPNPFANQLRVSTFGLDGKGATVKVLDLSGRVLLASKIESTADFAVYEVETTELEPGMYIVQIESGLKSQSFKMLHK